MERIDKILVAPSELSTPPTVLVSQEDLVTSLDQSSQTTFDCPRCKGARYLRRNVPFGHPDFGKPLECLCLQNQRKAQQQQHLRNLSHIERLPRFRATTFDTFDASRFKGLKEAFLAAMRFAGRPSGWLVLAGQHLAGKTHLAIAIAQECLAHNDEVLIVVVAELLDQLRSAFAPTAPETYEAIFTRTKTVPILILDDLPEEQETPWATEKLYQLLNYRYNAMLPTVITTGVARLDALDPRLAARLLDTTFVTCIVIGPAPGPVLQHRPPGSQDKVRPDPVTDA